MANETITAPEEQVVAEPTDSGMDANVMAAVAYLFGFVTGLIVFLVEKKNSYVRFHAAQSMALSAVLFVAYITASVLGFVMGMVGGDLLGLLFGLVMLFVWLAVGLGGFVLWLYMMISAYQGKTVRLPIVAGIADRIAGSGDEAMTAGSGEGTI